MEFKKIAPQGDTSEKGEFDPLEEEFDSRLHTSFTIMHSIYKQFVWWATCP